MDCSPPGSSVPGVLQARVLECAAVPSFRGSSQTRDRTWVCFTAGRLFITEPPAQLFTTELNTLVEPPGSTLPGRGSSQTRDRTWVSFTAGRLFTTEPPATSSLPLSSILWFNSPGIYGAPPNCETTKQRTRQSPSTKEFELYVGDTCKGASSWLQTLRAEWVMGVLCPGKGSAQSSQPRV